MKNPLVKRLPRELKSEFGKYFVIFMFLAGMIAIVSGFLVANNSMNKAYDESFEKYNIEDGNFEIASEADDLLIKKLENENTKIYQNFYFEEETQEVDSTLRIFKNREEINRACLMYGEFPKNEKEIAIDRMYADNNNLKVGDNLTVGNKNLKICGLVALSDYSALYSNPSDMMFDAMKFGVAVMTETGFESFESTHLHYSYSWKYDTPPENDSEAKTMSEDFLKILAENSIVTNYIPQYTNQAIHFTGDDIKGDNAMITVFLYIVVLIIAFIFAITASSTISKEAPVIGTLRASGYSKGELIRHYLTMPLIVILIAAIIGNILGYTYFKDFMADMYYNSYSLPTYVTLWNANAFIKTTIVPLVIMMVINLVVLINKLSLSPLKFIRCDLKKRKKKKAFHLNTKIGIIKRFQLRIIFQNIPNYITIIFGVFFANFLLLFGFMFSPLLDHYQSEITSNMISEYQYILKAPSETSNATAEKYCAGSLKTTDKKLKSEEVTIYGINNDSKYIDLNLYTKETAISNAFAEKFGIEKGDTITLKENYGDNKYTFKVSDIYYYPAGIALFMNRNEFNSIFDYGSEYFNGYFSDNEISDIEDMNIATVITQDDLTKTTRQLQHSIGNMMTIFLIFGVVMFMLIIYLLSKIIIEKNAQPISMAKILGYNNKEINILYIMSTTIVVILSIIITIPLCNMIMKYVCIAVFSDYSGWLPYYVPLSVYVKMAAMGICSYAVVAFLQVRRIKKIPLDEALKNRE